MIRPTSLGLPLLLLAGLACTPDKEETLDGSSPSEPLTFTVVCEGNQPLDATPTSDGSEYYYIGLPNETSTLFHVDAEGNPTTLVSGSPLNGAYGVSIAPDDSLIYVADSGYQDGDGDFVGAILAFLPDGTLSAVLAEGTHPLSVHAEAGGDLIFTGTDDVQDPAVFRLSGGDQQELASGELLNDLGAATSTPSGAVYAAAGIGANDDGTLYVLNGNIPEKVLTGLIWGNPTGLSSTLDGTKLLLSISGEAGDPVDIVGIYSLSDGSLTNVSAGGKLGYMGTGLHRAANADIWSYVDMEAGDNGRIYRVTPNE